MGVLRKSVNTLLGKKGKVEEKMNERMRNFKISGIPKRLTKDGKLLQDTFLANNTMYRIFPATEVLTIDRMEKLRHLNIIFGTGETPKDIKIAFHKVTNLLCSLLTSSNQEEKNKALLECMGISHSYSETFLSEDKNTLQYGSALYICTLFILPEGVDLSKEWSFEEADKYIDDWKQENISILDFFLLATVLCNESTTILTNYSTTTQKD